MAGEVGCPLLHPGRTLTRLGAAQCRHLLYLPPPSISPSISHPSECCCFFHHLKVKNRKEQKGGDGQAGMGLREEPENRQQCCYFSAPPRPLDAGHLPRRGCWPGQGASEGPATRAPRGPFLLSGVQHLGPTPGRDRDVPTRGVGWGAHTISLDYSLILIPRGRVIYPVLVITATPASGPGPSLLQSPLPLAEGLKCLGRTRTQVSPSHGPTLTPGACTASPRTNQHTGRVVAADTFTVWARGLGQGPPRGPRVLRLLCSQPPELSV